MGLSRQGDGFILPMRNWNLDDDAESEDREEGIYLTYEELKQRCNKRARYSKKWFYLTYEELKTGERHGGY